MVTNLILCSIFFCLACLPQVAMGGLQLYRGAPSPEDLDDFFLSQGGMAFTPKCVFGLAFNLNSVSGTHAYLNLQNLSSIGELLRPGHGASSYEVRARVRFSKFGWHSPRTSNDE